MNRIAMANELLRLARLIIGYKPGPLSMMEMKRELTRAKGRIDDAYSKAFKKTGDKKQALRVMEQAIETRLSRITKPVKMWATAIALKEEGHTNLAKEAFDMLKDMGYDNKGRESS